MNLEFYIRMRDMMSSGLVKMASTASKTSASIKGVNGTLAQSYDTIRIKIRDLESAINKSTSISHIRSARRELDQLQRMASRAPGNLVGGSGFFSGMFRQALPALGFAGAMMMGGNAYSSSMLLEGQQSAINFATDGQGANAVSKVRSINNKYGLSNEFGMEGFKTLAGSVRSLNIPLQETLRIYESVGAAGAAMKIDAEAQKGIFLALGQIASKGTVSAEELRGQIGERLPGAFGIAAKAMGVSEQALGKMMQQGELLSKDFLPMFATELQKTFGEAAVNSAESSMAVYNRFKNTILDLKNSIGEKLLPVMASLQNAFITSVEWVKENWNWVGLLASTIGSLFIGYQLWIGYQNALNISMMMNPVGLLVGAIAALVVGVIWAWNHFEGFRKTIYSVWEVMKVLWGYIYKFIKPGLDSLVIQFQLFKLVVSQLWDVFKVVFDKIADYFSVVFGPIIAAIKWLWNKAGASGLGGEIAAAWNRGQATGLADAMIGPGAGLKATAVTPEGTTVADVFGLRKGASAGDDGGVSRGITGGGPRVVNINGVKFTEKIEIHSNTVGESIDDLETKLQEMFLRVLNSGAALQ